MKIVKITRGQLFGNSETVLMEGPKSKVLPEYKRQAKALRTDKSFDGGTEFDLPNKKLIDMWKGTSAITLKLIG